MGRAGMFLMLLVGLVCCTTQRHGRTPINRQVFTTSHLGYWKGDLSIFKNDSLQQQVSMEFNILLTDTPGLYKWQIRYQGQEMRNYRLQVLDSSRGKYQIDEKNHIILPADLNNNTLQSCFSVMGNTLLIGYDFSRTDRILFTVSPFSSAAERYTGQQNTEIDSVGVYSLKGAQQAILLPVK